LTSDVAIGRLGMMFFALILIGGYGITKYIYDK
jgi:hypothetical protein